MRPDDAFDNQNYLRLNFSIMLKKSLYFLMLLFVGVFVFSSCGDDDEDKELTQKDRLIARWQGETYTETTKIAGIPFNTETEQISDNFIEFKSNGTYTITAPDDESVFENGSGTWKLINNDTELLLDENTEDEQSFKILTLTDNNLQVFFSMQDTFDGVVFDFEITIDLKK